MQNNPIVIADRVTQADLDDNIVHTEIVKHVSQSGQVLRWAVLTTRNGFAVTGRPSAAVSPANDVEARGVEIAIENARNELWALMGYALRERIAQQLAPVAVEPQPQERRSLFAYTRPNGVLPPYISINREASGQVSFSVRQAGENRGSDMLLEPAQALALARAVLANVPDREG